MTRIIRGLKDAWERGGKNCSLTSLANWRRKQSVITINRIAKGKKEEKQVFDIIAVKSLQRLGSAAEANPTLASIKPSLQHRGTLKGHDPPLGKHQIFTAPRVSTPTLALVPHAEFTKAAYHHILS